MLVRKSGAATLNDAVDTFALHLRHWLDGNQLWIEPDADGTFYYCTEVISADTAEEAWADLATSDASDPDNGGCGGFPWTKLTVKQ